MDNGQPTVLCVDDEPQVLAGLTLHLRRRFAVLTATSGAAGLETLQQHPETAVVVSDMRMPGMDGATFLSHARQCSPDTVRILLTGHSDLDSAIAAVNNGQLFRFLTKPCPASVLLTALQAASDHHRLITAERVLLEQTLRGSIKALTDVMGLRDPMAFGRAARLKECVADLAAQLKLQDRWQVEVAAMLSQLGFIALPAETAEKVYYGRPLSDEETQMVARVPAVTEQLLGSIPRLEVVRGILGAYMKPYRAIDEKAMDAQTQLIHRGAHMLRVAVDFEALEVQGHSPTHALDLMRARADSYDPPVFEAIKAVRCVDNSEEIREVRLAELQVGMVFAEDVKTDVGTLLVGRGFEVTAGVVERVRNIRRGTVREPVRVVMPKVKQES